MKLSFSLDRYSIFPRKRNSLGKSEFRREKFQNKYLQFAKFIFADVVFKFYTRFCELLLFGIILIILYHYTNHVAHSFAPV